MLTAEQLETARKLVSDIYRSAISLGEAKISTHSSGLLWMLEKPAEQRLCEIIRKEVVELLTSDIEVKRRDLRLLGVEVSDADIAVRSTGRSGNESPLGGRTR